MEIYMEEGHTAVAAAVIAAVDSGGELGVRRRSGNSGVWVARLAGWKCEINAASMAAAATITGMHMAASGLPYLPEQEDASVWDVYGRRAWEWAHWMKTGAWVGPENLRPAQAQVPI